LVETEGLLDSNGLNSVGVKCQSCESKILPPQLGKLQEQEFRLHILKAKADPEKAEYEKLKQFWVINDMFDFDNVGFSHTLDGIKYLVCADCEKGPIGYHDTKNGGKNCYLALARVRHVQNY